MLSSTLATSRGNPGDILRLKIEGHWKLRDIEDITIHTLEGLMILIERICMDMQLYI